MHSNTKNKEIDVSILIRTKNEEKYIIKVLDSVFSQSFKNFEVIIVDGGSTDKTLEIAKGYPVKVLEIKPNDFTFGYSLNLGFQHTAGKYIASLSGHASPLSEDWLKIAISNFSDHNIAAVMCKTLPWPDCNPFDRRGLLKKYGIPKQVFAKGPPFIFSNSSSVIRKIVWEKIHFDETLTASEDEDWAEKARKLNYKIIFEPSAEVYHSHNWTLKQIYRRAYNEERSIEQRSSEAPELKPCTLTSLFFYDLFLGSVYDMFNVLIKRDGLKWFFHAPLRRLAMAYGKFSSFINKSNFHSQ